MIESTSAPPDPGQPALSRWRRAATQPADWPVTRQYKFGWVAEALVITVVSYTYETVRNLVTGHAATALRNAKAITAVERWLGIYQERAIQSVFLDVPWLVAFWNFYYDTAHFFFPLFVGIYLYVKFPARYVLVRNAYFILLLGLGMLVWLVLPITAPKWMPARYGFVDTQAEYFNVGPQKPLRYGADGEPAADVVAQTGNPYGGLPSHHVSWALLFVIGLWPVVRRRWVKALLVGHILLTIGAITVTGNHRFLDIGGSIIEVAVAYGLAYALQSVLARRRASDDLVAPAFAET
jgi:hypothetical protein